MSIYIKGIYKPERCIDCYFLNQKYLPCEHTLISICELTRNKTIKPLANILPDCPIIEVED